MLRIIRKEVNSTLPMDVFRKRNQCVLNQLLKCKENRVMMEFSDRLGISPYQIILHDKSGEACLPRQLYCMLRRCVHKKSLVSIKEEVGRDTRTIKKSANLIKDLIDLNDEKVQLSWSKVKDIEDDEYFEDLDYLDVPLVKSELEQPISIQMTDSEYLLLRIIKD